MQHLFLILPPLLTLLAGCTQEYTPVEQRPVARIETMPAAPERFALADWRQIALDLDRYLYDFEARGEHLPLIWLDSARRNVPTVSFGLYTAVGDLRQGPRRNNGEHHEALGVLGSIYGSTLVGIDKSRQEGLNYVRMCQNYFNSATGWNIVMNNTCPESGALGGGYGRDFWYDIFPNMLFYAIGEHYPDVDGVDAIMHTVAEQFTAADSVIMHTVGNYRLREFDFGRMQPGNRERMLQSDAAAGFAYVLYGAWRKYGDPRYLRAARSAMDALNAETGSPFYEVIMPFAVYMAARMNAEAGSAYDVAKFFDWTFDGQSRSRPGWGVLTGSFDSYAVDGLCGSVSEEYAFAMNTFALMWPLLPAVRYDQSFARAVGRWAVNAVGNARYFYPQYVAPAHQSLTDTSIARGVIAYEGFRRHDKYDRPQLQGVEGVAIGDGPQWVAGNPQHAMLSVYGSAYAGIFGAAVRPTNIEKILQLDCTATDLFAQSHPTYLYYNPYATGKSVRIDLGPAPTDLYDTVSRTYLCRRKSGVHYFDLAPDAARVVVLLPAGGRRRVRDGVLYVDGIPVDYRL